MTILLQTIARKAVHFFSEEIIESKRTLQKKSISRFFLQQIIVTLPFLFHKKQIVIDYEKKRQLFGYRIWYCGVKFCP